MSLYDEMQGIAQGLFKEFGQGVVKYIQVTPGNGTVDNPGASVETPFTLVGAAVRGVMFKYVQMNLAVASDKQIAMPVDARFTPQPNGLMDVDGIRYKIKQIIRHPDAGTIVSYTILCGK